MTVWKSFKKSLKWDQSGISSFIRLKVTSKTSKLFQKWEKFHIQDNCPKSPWNCSCLTGYISVIFERIYKKLVTVWKVLKRSLKWDQTGIFSLICLKVTSKIRTIVKKIGLKKIATKLWRAITPKNLQQLYRSMPWQTHTIIDAGGAHASYWNKILAFVCCIWSSY